jgi:hypothetical protein
VVATLRFGVAAVAINGALLRVCPERETSLLTSVDAVALVMVVNVAMVSASLYFMWSIRNPRLPTVSAP